jgi:predicted ATP-dependent endonuclease of OLD family
MKLLSVRVENYRSIEDSEEFTCDEITALVGKNESGKTNILKALYKFNPLPAQDLKEISFDKTADYPRRYLAEYDERHDGEANVVSTKWLIEDKDKQKIPYLNFLKSNEVSISKGYGNNFSIGDLDLDEVKLVGYFNAQVSGNGYFSDVTTYSSFIKKLDETELQEKLDPEKLASLKKTIEPINKSGSIRQYMLNEIVKLLPQFFYFSHYDSMCSKISVKNLQSQRANNSLSKGDEVFLSFLKNASLSLEDVENATKYEEINSKLEAASNSVTKKIFKYWSQNEHLKIHFELRDGYSEDPIPFNSGRIIEVRIENKLHEATLSLDARSAGLIWFFSFLAYFSQIQKEFGENIILLLDEPGLTLHGDAQQDLIRFINEQLKPKHQVIYSTHSPFMIDSDNLLSVRTVEDRVTHSKKGNQVTVHGTKVGEDTKLSKDSSTLFPLYKILGIELTQTLFVGKHCLLVEGVSDLLYLKAFSELLRRKDRVFLDLKWTICPVGGIDKMSSFINLFSANKINITPLVDVTNDHKKQLAGLEARCNDLNRIKIQKVTDYLSKPEGDIEDLLGNKNYFELINPHNIG